MNKTASLIIRILALAAAGAAGYAWYTIDSQNLKVAMQNTEWMTRDDEIKAGQPFVERMGAMPNVNKLLGEKRDKITELTEEKNRLTNDLADRNRTISEQKSEIGRLEGERIELIRKRDEFKEQATKAEAKAAQLEDDLNKATGDLARKNEQIASMFTKEQYEEQVQATNTANDERDKVVGKYYRLYNWTEKQGLTPPYNKNPLLPDDPSTQPKQGPEKINTQIVMIDRRNGIMAISLGAENNILPGQVFTLERGGDAIGKIKVSEIRSGLTIVSLLPGTQHQLLTKDAIITLAISREQAAPVENAEPTPAVVPATTTPAAPATETTTPAAEEASVW
jgi:hypothetical protein